MLQVYIVKKVLSLYDDYYKLKAISKEKQTVTWQQNKLQPFLNSIQNCLDISCKDPVALGKQEKFHGVKMTEVEGEFLTDQLGPRLMLCTTEVDRYESKIIIFLISSNPGPGQKQLREGTGRRKY